MYFIVTEHCNLVPRDNPLTGGQGTRRATRFEQDGAQGEVSEDWRGRVENLCQSVYVYNHLIN